MGRRHVYSGIESLFCREILPSKRNFNRVYFGNGISSNRKILQLGYFNNYLQYVKKWNYSEKEENIPSTNTLNREYCVVNLAS